MSQVSTSTGMTTTPPVTVVSSGMSSLSSVIMALSSMGLPTALGQHNVVLLPPLTPRYSGGVLGHASVPQQQPPSLMPLQACANYTMGSPWVGFFFRVEPPTVCILYVWCLFWCLLSIFRCHAGCHIHPWGPNHWGLHHCNPLEFRPTAGMHRVAAFSTTLSRGSLMLLCLLFPSYPIYMVGPSALGTWQRVTQSLHLS